MSLFDLGAILLTIAALLSYVNERYLRLPTTIGLMLIALLLSLGLISTTMLGWDVEARAEDILASIDFSELLLHSMLAFLLFAGALHVNLEDLLQQKWIISSLATFGVLTSTILVAVLTWISLGFLDLDLPFLYCLLFGALISPTDPIAVLGILKSCNTPKSLETKITGESLFNDGVGVVVFIVLLDTVKGGHALEPDEVMLFFLQEAVALGSKSNKNHL